MNTVPITPCAQCPSCRQYVPIANNTFTDVSEVSTVSRRMNTNIPEQSTLPRQHIAPVTNIRPNRSLSDYENSWRSKFARLPTLSLGIVQLTLTVLIILLEITTLGLSTYKGTGAGIWCSIVFLPTATLTFLLAYRWERSRLWSTRVLIAQIVLIIFCFTLIGIVGNYLSAGNVAASAYITSYTDTKYTTKYQVMQAQLAFGILLLFSGICFVIFYGVVTYLALWKPFHTLDKDHLFRE